MVNRVSAMIHRQDTQIEGRMALLYEEEGYQLIGAAMAVYSEMGAGFLEEVYQECMENEMIYQKIPFESQAPLDIWYKRKKLKKRYKPDLFVFDKIIVELKAQSYLTSKDEAQLLNYLKGARVKVGYLFNFGHEAKLEFKRMVF